MPLRTEWRNIDIRRVSSLINRRYREKPLNRVGETLERHFYLSEEYASGEVFCEKIQEGFWMIAIEIKAKQNTRYYSVPKSITNLHSANFFLGSQKIGYQIAHKVHWAESHSIYLNSSDVQNIYIKAGTVLKYCRLIYHDSFLSTLLRNDENIEYGTVALFDGLRNRTTLGSELFLQNRLFSILRHERNMGHYRASLFSLVYGLTTSFLKLSSVKKTIVNTEAKKIKMDVMLKAVAVLEAHLSESFPGIVKLASDCNISVSKLKRDFKEAFGVTPLNYFRNIQITHAADAYSNGEKAVKEIAADLGFKKPSTFSFWYKRLRNGGQNTSEEYNIKT